MNILSIDIDYAFSPDIAKYDDYVNGSKLTSEEEWLALEARGFTKPSVNNEKLNVLIKVFTDALLTTEQVYFLNNHHEIVPFLQTSSAHKIVNFDHHHDIFYPGWHTMETLDEGNWVGWIDSLGLISSYTWYKNEDSEELDSTVNLSCHYHEELYNDQALPEFDLIFVCSSPNWIHEDNIYVLNSFKETKADGKIRL